MPPPYKPPMGPGTFAVLFVLFVVGAFGFAWLHKPPVAGTYEGVAEDLPAGALGKINLILEETKGRLAGRLTLPPVMPEGGGELTGTLENDRLVFVTIDAEGHKMTWTAQKGPRCLVGGNYWWGEMDEKGRNNNYPLGRWEATLQ